MSLYYNSFLCLKKPNTVISISMWYPFKIIAFLINLKYMTVTWLFEMAKLMWVNFNCPCPCPFQDCLEVYENCADSLSNNLRLHEISILIFFQFFCKISRNQLEIVVEATYGLHSY